MPLSGAAVDAGRGLGRAPRPRRRSTVTASTPRLPGGPYWPGGIAAHANGDLHVVFGHWAHRLSPELEVLASHRLPVERPHNSFVVLDGGELVTKDCDAPAGLEPSTVSVLDPETLLPVAEPLRLPEPVDRAALERRRERDRGRHHASSSGCASTATAGRIDDRRALARRATARRPIAATAGTR